MKKIHTKKNQVAIVLNDEEMGFLKRNYRSMSDKELLKGLKQMGCDITFGKLRQIKYDNRLIKQKQIGWTDYQVQYLLDHYQTLGNVAIAEHFGWPSKNKKGEKKVWKKMIQMGLKRTRKQQLALIKLQPRLRKDDEVWFQESSGHMLTKRDGELLYFARVVWEENHGPIPDGMCVCQKDDDRKNCDIENLELLSRSEVSKRYLAAATENLHDSFIISTLTIRKPELKPILKKYPKLIELQRQRILNNRKIKQLENAK